MNKNAFLYFFRQMNTFKCCCITKVYKNIFFNIATLQIDVLKSVSDILPLGIIMKHYRTIDHLYKTCKHECNFCLLLNKNASCIKMPDWVIRRSTLLYASTCIYRVIQNKIKYIQIFSNNCQYFFLLRIHWIIVKSQSFLFCFNSCQLLSAHVLLYTIFHPV